jgi:DNA polymerase (family 10)
MVLYTERGIDSVDGLAAAIDAGRLDGLRGFGPKTEENLLRGIDVIRKTGDRVLLSVAMELAEELTGLLACWPRCQDASASATAGRCAGCGTPSATWTSSRSPISRVR